MSEYTESALMSAVTASIPPLTSYAHKGQYGRVGVLGGCLTYSGAPYFAAISAFRTGADLVHVFCPSEVGPIIKAYSPDLIVHPSEGKVVDEIDPWLPRMHSFVVGPGLGRSNLWYEQLDSVFEQFQQREMPVVIDADGVNYVVEHPDAIKGMKRTIITPNAMEFGRLTKAVLGQEAALTDNLAKQTQQVRDLATALGNVTVLRKGRLDIISDGNSSAFCESEGSPRRCGGQGDVLSGAAALFFHWALQKHTGNINPGVVAAFAAARLTRECSRLAFQRRGRSTIASDLVENLQSAFTSVFGQ